MKVLMVMFVVAWSEVGMFESVVGGRLECRVQREEDLCIEYVYSLYVQIRGYMK